MNNYIYNSFFCVTNKNQFESGLNDMLASVIPYGVYVGDNFISLNRNLSFLSDEKLMNAAERNLDLVTEKATLWRIHVLLWAMRNGLQLEGDFVECACYKGNSAKVLCDTVSLGEYPEKNIICMICLIIMKLCRIIRCLRIVKNYMIRLKNALRNILMWLLLRVRFLKSCTMWLPKKLLSYTLI